MIPSARRRLSQAPPPNVNLYCKSCNSQIGIFDNEWIRLTSSYARAKDKGTHFGTDIAQKIQVVPLGVAQKAAEGCSMAEVFCRKCSNTVAQYCKSAPDAEKQHLVNQYFYKLSRTCLKDAHTSKPVDHIFGYSGGMHLPRPIPSPNPRTSLPPARRWSQTPLQHNQTPAETPLLHLASERDGRYSMNDSFSSPAEIHSDNVIMQRLAELERRLADHGIAPTPSDSGTTKSRSNLAVSSQNPSAVDGVGPSVQHEKSTNNELAIIGHIEALQNTMVAFQASIQEIWSFIRAERAPAPLDSSVLEKLEAMIEAAKDSHPSIAELKALREENRSLQSRWNTIASAMDIATREGSALGDLVHGSSDQATEVVNILGKRKRKGEQVRPASLQLTNSLRSRESRLRGSFDGQIQIPTPQSGQSHGDSEPSPSLETMQRQARSSDWTSQSDLGIADDQDNQIAGPEPNHQPELVQGRDENMIDAGKPAGEPQSPESSTAEPYDPIPASDRDISQAAVMGGPIDFSDDEPVLQDEASTVNVQIDTTPESGIGVVESAILVGVVPSSQLAGPAGHVEDPPQGDVSFRGARPLSGEERRITLEPVMPNNFRSMAPSTAPSEGMNRRRRTLPTRKIPIGIDNVTILTPDVMRQKIAKKGMAKPLKERVQTTEKLLNQELEELGLSEWIGKEKNSSEYRAAIEAARAQQREAKKLSTLASRGLKPKSAAAVKQSKSGTTAGLTNKKSSKAVASTRRSRSIAGNSKASPLSEAVNTQGKKTKAAGEEQPTEEEKDDSSIAGMMTRRQQRDEIRKRDQMAKEAMEREEIQ